MPDLIHRLDDPLSEPWLIAAGFKWHQLDRQPHKHWLLWLGDALVDDWASGSDELGIEVSTSASLDLHGWFCWLRSDTAHRYGRFIHIRHVRTPRDVSAMIFGLTGREFNAEDCFYGRFLSPELAERERRDRDRLDRRLLHSGHPWREIERDETRGGALPEHLEAAEKARGEVKR